MRTHVYVDGFNLYYGCIRGTDFHWLDLESLLKKLLPDLRIERIHYFTAIVAGRKDDPDTPIRQHIYLRALRTLETVQITLGHFLTHRVPMPLVKPLDSGRRTALVWKTEEKGSDVNLASLLLHEAHLGLYETAVVVSNDSDLLLPIQLVRGALRKRVGIVNPNRLHPSRVLAANCDFIRQIRNGALRSSQFPDVLTDARGSFANPFRDRRRREGQA